MALSFDDIKSMSLKKKIATVFVAFILFGALYFTYLYQPIAEKRWSLIDRLQTLEMKIAARRRVVAEIEKHKKDIEKLRKNLKIALAKLPDKKEIPPLLKAVSQAGTDVGLDFVLFQPVDPISKDFFAEIPVQITVEGLYQNIIAFCDAVAVLPRIVNITKIKIVPEKAGHESGYTLVTSCTLKTYMFIEDADEESQETENE